MNLDLHELSTLKTELNQMLADERLSLNSEHSSFEEALKFMGHLADKEIFVGIAQEEDKHFILMPTVSDDWLSVHAFERDLPYITKIEVSSELVLQTPLETQKKYVEQNT